MYLTHATDPPAGGTLTRIVKEVEEKEQKKY